MFVLMFQGFFLIGQHFDWCLLSSCNARVRDAHPSRGSLFCVEPAKLLEVSHRETVDTSSQNFQPNSSLHHVAHTYTPKLSLSVTSVSFWCCPRSSRRRRQRRGLRVSFQFTVASFFQVELVDGSMPALVAAIGASH
mmetsp:Transcript_2296/g.6632  ORF Transcript_2296/g.6632 Transcript_2296/m.6632 type:complete len:137 (+) Transcript_2296:809-1219(+)